MSIMFLMKVPELGGIGAPGYTATGLLRISFTSSSASACLPCPCRKDRLSSQAKGMEACREAGRAERAEIPRLYRLRVF